MSFEYFIAKRLLKNRTHLNKVSSPIITIAIIAIAISMVMMIIAVATGIGLQQKIREKIVSFNGHITISNFDDNQSEVSLVPVSKNQSFYPKFSQVSGISHIQAVASKAGIIRTEKTFEGIIFKGVGTDYDTKYLTEYLTQGRFPVFKTGEYSSEILLSEYLANRLQVGLNDKLTMYFMRPETNKLPFVRQFSIVGLYNSGFHDFDASLVLGDIQHIQRMNKWSADQVGAFEVYLENFDEIDRKGKEIYNEIPSKLTSKTITEKYYNIFEWLKLFDTNIILILTIMIVVATVNMIVALLVLILERTQMIGILKALGASNWQIRKIFLYNAAYLIIKGLLWGNAIAIILLLVQKYLKPITLAPESYYVRVAPVYIHWSYILWLNIGTIIVCLLVLILPSYRISKISPVKAIRFE